MLAHYHGTAMGHFPTMECSSSCGFEERRTLEVMSKESPLAARSRSKGWKVDRPLLPKPGFRRSTIGNRGAHCHALVERRKHASLWWSNCSCAACLNQDHGSWSIHLYNHILGVGIPGTRYPLHGLWDSKSKSPPASPSSERFSVLRDEPSRVPGRLR